MPGGWLASRDNEIRPKAAQIQSDRNYGHKKHKNATANETLKAPMGAQNICLGMTNQLCDFLWQ
jgi:hypothetical protein